jgi:predicted ATP-grasp superfamily ATP-dependent carboligase
VPLCVSRQLIGDSAFGASGYRYCGSILAPCGDESFGRDEALVETACALAQTVAEAFGLVGVNGVDFIAREGTPHTIEVNPRWSASMELAERAYGISVFKAHAEACAAGTLPAFDLGHARRNQPAVGKAIVFARCNVTVGDTRRWIEDARVRDVPHPGERISTGQPVCTVMAEGRTAAACYESLVRRAGRLYEELIPTSRT